MSLTDHREYLERRRLESIARAEQTDDPLLAHIYRRFAVHYAKALGEDGTGHLRVVGG